MLQIVFLVFVFMILSAYQLATDQFHPSNLEISKSKRLSLYVIVHEFMFCFVYLSIGPDFVLLNSSNSSVVDFFCINRQSDDNIQFVIHISKNISKNQLKISRHQINRTLLHIRLRFRNYIGLFHLYCYLKDQKDHGTRADVIARSK